MKKAISLILCLTMALALCGCGQKGTGEFTTDKVVMTYVASPLNVPSVLEKQQGGFAAAFGKLGLGFAYSDLDSGADQTAALASGDIHILNGVGGSSVIMAAANGADIRIISMYSAAPKAFAMYSADASINSPADLKGKTVAGPKGTNLHELLAAYLATGQMTEKDVNFVSMDIPSSAAALDGGSVDAALLGGPAAYQCEQKGYHKVCDGEGLIAATIVTATTAKFAAENPGIIEAFKAEQNRIVDEMRADEEAAFAVTAEALGLELSAVRDMYAMYDFDTALTAEDVAAIQSTEAFLYDNGLIENHVDIQSIVL